MPRKTAATNARQHDADALALLWLAIRCDVETRGSGPQRCSPTVDAGTLDRLAQRGLLEQEGDGCHVRLTDPGATAAAFVTAALGALTQGGLGRTLLAATSRVAASPLRHPVLAKAPRRRATSRSRESAAAVLRIRVEFEHVQPAIWRVIEIDADSTFFDLHVAINAAMGWEDSHLHHFVVGFGRAAQGKAARYSSPDEDPFDSPFDERLEFEHRVVDGVRIGDRRCLAGLPDRCRRAWRPHPRTDRVGAQPVRGPC